MKSVVLNTLLQLFVITVLLYFWSQRQPGLIKNVLLFLALADLVTIPFTFATERQR